MQIKMFENVQKRKNHAVRIDAKPSPTLSYLSQFPILTICLDTDLMVKTTDCYPIGSGIESRVRYGFFRRRLNFSDFLVVYEDD
jgi:hypothetical protein